uniref:Retroviral polymerase SH3-like domain-containing protein n=1 Tax=Cajanus cajan TaxID=3821 RepID=A0A151RKI4_CAJCA|nr:hypothetical protein KK1_035513 [Cajanus cajan]
MKTFGCACYPCLKPYNQHKLQFHTTKCVFLGYSGSHKGYKCLNSTGRIFISRHVVFNNIIFPFMMARASPISHGSSTRSNSSISQGSTDIHNNNNSSSNTKRKHQVEQAENQNTIDATISQNTLVNSRIENNIESINQHQMTTRSKMGTIKPKKPYVGAVEKMLEEQEPETTHEALENPEWRKAMIAEFKALMMNKTCTLVPYQGQKNIIDCKWVDASGLYLKQTKYVFDLLKKLNLEHVSSCPTPMVTGRSLSEEVELMKNPTLYRREIGALQYLTNTRPDIAYSVNVKRVFRYLKGTMNHCLHIKPSADLDITGFSPADWATNIEDRKSIAGYCVFLGESLITWSSKKQRVVSRSSTESEYRALADLAAKVAWIRSLLQEIKLKIPRPPILWCDNLSAKALATNPVY